MRYERPKYVGDAIEVRAGNLHVGIYGPYQLFSAYQPIFRLNGDNKFEICAYEGLVRPFISSEPVRPDKFFAGLARPDYLFIECMCRALHLRNYRLAQPSKRTLFVNMDISRYSNFHDMQINFNYFIDRAEGHGLQIDKMVFEILESRPREDSLLIRTRDMLRSRGVKIAIDDFGQQYSNLERYLVLRPEIVKIDRKLFLKACSDQSFQNILKTQIGQFRDRGTTVLVEGVETFEQSELASHLGAELQQGFLFERPVLLPASFEHIKAAASPLMGSNRKTIAS